MTEKTSITQKLAKGEHLDAWRQFKGEYPAAYTVAAVLPVSGQLAAVADYAQAADEGSTADGVTAAASLIPGVRLGKLAGRLTPAALRLGSKMTAAERTIAPVVRNAPGIGKAAAIEQAVDYVDVKRRADEQKSRDDAEYQASWDSDK